MCAFCGPLCSNHSDFLHVTGPMRSHDVRKIEPGVKPKELDDLRLLKESGESSKMPVCFEHKKRCEFFCQQCNALVCWHCVCIGEHKGHRCISVSELFRNMSSELAKIVKEIREGAPRCAELLKGFEMLESKADEEHKATVEEVDKFFNAAHDALEQKRKEVLEQVDGVYKEFFGTVVHRKNALKTLYTKCDDFLEKNAAEDSIPKDKIEQYTLFRTLCELNSVVNIVAKTNPPDEKSKICCVSYKDFFSGKSFRPARVRQAFKWGVSHFYTCDINLDRLAGTSSTASAIPTVERSSHDGAALYDQQRNIILAVSGNGNNCRNVAITHLTDAMHGETEVHADLIPFNSHGQYPIYDGVEYVYFLESEGEDEDVRFGILNLDTLTFEALPDCTHGFKEFCSGCCVAGKIYVVDNDDHMEEYDPKSNLWIQTPLLFHGECRLLADPVEEDSMFMLEYGTRGLSQIDLATFTTSIVSAPEHEFDLSENGEALIVALPNGTRALFTFLSGYWYCYLFERNTWIELEHWKEARNGSAHLVIIPEGPTALYHVDEESEWTAVNLG